MSNKVCRAHHHATQARALNESFKPGGSTGAAVADVSAEAKGDEVCAAEEETEPAELMLALW